MVNRYYSRTLLVAMLLATAVFLLSACEPAEAPAPEEENTEEMAQIQQEIQEVMKRAEEAELRVQAMVNELESLERLPRSPCFQGKQV